MTDAEIDDYLYKNSEDLPLNDKQLDVPKNYFSSTQKLTAPPAGGSGDGGNSLSSDMKSLNSAITSNTNQLKTNDTSINSNTDALNGLTDALLNESAGTTIDDGYTGVISGLDGLKSSYNSLSTTFSGIDDLINGGFTVSAVSVTSAPTCMNNSMIVKIMEYVVYLRPVLMLFITLFLLIATIKIYFYGFKIISSNSQA